MFSLSLPLSILAFNLLFTSSYGRHFAIVASKNYHHPARVAALPLSFAWRKALAKGDRGKENARAR